jgi:hypothetical protein
MGATYKAWTFFEGDFEDAKEIAQEWNEVARTDTFRAVVHDSRKNVHRVEGVVQPWVIRDTNIENEFVIEY